MALKDLFATKFRAPWASFFANAKNKEEIAGELEELLLLADIALPVVERIMANMGKKAKSHAGKEEILDLLRRELLAVFEGQRRPALGAGEKNVILLVGVNGSGKTTSAAKLARYYQDRGLRVLLAAADTFRAAGSSQLTLWGEKLGIPVVSGERGADPGSVIFNAMQSWAGKDFDLLVIDTAGRMQSKENLMRELEKITKIIRKFSSPAAGRNLAGAGCLHRPERAGAGREIQGVFRDQRPAPGQAGRHGQGRRRHQHRRADAAPGHVRRPGGNRGRPVGFFRERIRGFAAGRMSMKQGPGSGQQADDRKFMKIALRLSQKGLGYTEPNPMVGAVAVKNGRILASGFHAAFGARHAEAMALERLAEPGATLYLTLEPCGHFGKTPPCVDLIIAKKVKRVVMAMEDPNPLVHGCGIRKLRAHGIRTSCGLFRDWAERINRHYLKAMRARSPFVTLHAGASLDGKLTDTCGHSRWVTSEQGRRISHSLRGEFSAILAGHGTILADNPRLTLREPGWQGKTLHRVVLDSNNSLSRRLNIFQEQERFPLVIFSSKHAANRKKKVPLHFFVRHGANGLVLADVLEQLFELGMASLLVEGGGRVLDSFIRERLFDEMALFLSDKIVGGRNSVQIFASGVDRLADALELVDCRWSEYEGGMMLRGYRKCSPA